LVRPVEVVLAGMTRPGPVPKKTSHYFNLKKNGTRGTEVIKSLILNKDFSYMKQC